MEQDSLPATVFAEQESPLALAQRVAASSLRRAGALVPCGAISSPACLGAARRCVVERESFAEHAWAPFRALALAPGLAVAATLGAYAVFVVLYGVLWAPLTALLPEPLAWACVLLGLRRGGGALARFATFPGSFATVRGEVEREYGRRLLGRLEHACYALESWWIDLHPRAASAVDQEAFARHCREAWEARDAILKPVLDAVDAARGAGDVDVGDVADLPDLTPRAAEALEGFRACLAAAVDACGGAERASLELLALRPRQFTAAHREATRRGAPGAAAALKLMDACRALAAACPRLREGGDGDGRRRQAPAPGAAAAAGRLARDAAAGVGRLLRSPCPPPADCPLGVGLLRAEFVLAYGATQFWVDAADGTRLDCCVVPPCFGRPEAESAPEAPPDPSPTARRRGASPSRCCRRQATGDDAFPARGAARPAPTVLFFSPNAVLYESFGMAPVDGAGWVATYARLGLQVVVWNLRGYGRTKGAPHPRRNADDALAVVAYLRDRCGVTKLVLHGESIGGMCATRVAAALAPPGGAPDGAAPLSVALVADRTFANLRVEAQYLTGVAGVASLLGLVTGWGDRDTDSRADYAAAQCPKLVACDCRDHMIPDQASLKAGAAAFKVLGAATLRRADLDGALRVADLSGLAPPPPDGDVLRALRAGALTPASLAQLFAAVRHVHRSARARAPRAAAAAAADPRAPQPFADVEAGEAAVAGAAAILARVDGGCGMALGQACGLDLGALTSWACAAAAWPNGAAHKLLDGPPPDALAKKGGGDGDDDDDDGDDDGGLDCAPPIAPRDAAAALAELRRTRGDDLGDAADAVAYVAEFLAKLADVADAAVAAAADARDPALGALLVLGCGHNAPWRRGERDAYLAWLGKEL